MKKWQVVFLVFLNCICMVTFAGTSREQRAFEIARNSWVEFVKTGNEQGIEIKWNESLKILALSKNKSADNYLAELSLLKLDGGLATEFTCAASKRGMHLARALKLKSKNHVGNSCVMLAKRNGVEVERLCSSRHEYKIFATRFQHLPMKDDAGVCSY
jgi:hypothetical protein